MESMNDEKIVTLIKDAQKGKDAFEQLVRYYQHDVFRIIRVYTQNDSDAEDLAQETWIKAYQSIGKLKEPYHLESWLRTVAVNTAKNWLKSRAYKESQTNDEIESQQLWGSAVIQYQRQKLLEQIRDAIDSLSTKNREVVLDFYICGYSASQISQRLNVPVSTVNSRLKEARKRLREEFESMVAQSNIREKFAPDSLVRNVMDRVASLPISSAPTGNIIQRIGRMFPIEAIKIIGFVLATFTVIALISIKVGDIHFDFKENAMSLWRVFQADDNEKKQVEDYILEADRINNQLAAFIDEEHTEAEILSEAEKYFRLVWLYSKFDFFWNDKGERIEGVSNISDSMVELYKANRGLRIGPRTIHSTEFREYENAGRIILTAFVRSEVTWLLNGAPPPNGLRVVAHFYVKTKDGWRLFGNGPQDLLNDFPKSLPPDLFLMNIFTVNSKGKLYYVWGRLKMTTTR